MNSTQDTVLIVDDTPANLSLLFTYLEKAGFKVLVASSGQAALEIVHRAAPDIILLDIMMPDMDGFEVCRRLKADKATRDIPVIFLTVLEESINEVKGLQLGAVDYITKPVKFEAVLARIKTHLTLHHLQKTLEVQNEQLQEENLRRKRIQELLKESRSRYRLLAENSTDIISRQTMAGVYSYVSPACRPVLGYEMEEMIGHSVYDFIHPEDLSLIQTSFESGQDEAAASPLTYRARRKDNSYIWLETTTKPVHDPQTGQILEIVAVSRDVTERKRLEETLRNQNSELNAFAHTVAHDLKSPLGVIVAYTHYLQEYSNQLNTAEKQEFLQVIRQTAQKMTNIIESLLLLAEVRTEEVELHPLDMADIVAQARQRLDFMMDEYQGKIIIPESWPEAAGYAPWVEEVWVNYLSNGLKYGGQPPRLELGATPQPQGMIRFWVRDNGQGISPEEQAKLFTEFTRLDEVGTEGYGLGLSIVRRILDKLGGQVGVESAVGAGSLFYFTLPGINKIEATAP